MLLIGWRQKRKRIQINLCFEICLYNDQPRRMCRMHRCSINWLTINPNDFEHFPLGWSRRCELNLGYSQIERVAIDKQRQDKNPNHVALFQGVSKQTAGPELRPSALTHKTGRVGKVTLSLIMEIAVHIWQTAPPQLKKALLQNNSNIWILTSYRKWV